MPLVHRLIDTWVGNLGMVLEQYRLGKSCTGTVLICAGDSTRNLLWPLQPKRVCDSMKKINIQYTNNARTAIQDQTDHLEQE